MRPPAPGPPAMARGRYSAEPELEHHQRRAAGSRARARPPRHSITALLDHLAVDHRGVGGVADRAAAAPRAAPSSAATQDPTASLKKPRLRLSSTNVGHVVASGEAQHVLALQPAHLVVGRDAGAQLHELVVEERHAHLERARHRGAVEVGEHVVHQAETGVQVERGLERRRAGRVGQPAAQQRLGGARVLGQRAAEQIGRSGPACTQPARGQQARDGVGCLKRVHEASARVPGRGAAPPPRPSAAERASAPTTRPARPRGACGSRRAARRRPGRSAPPSRARAPARTAARKPSEDRSASGSSRCQTSRASSSASLARGHLELVMVGAVPLRHPPGVAAAPSPRRRSRRRRS